MASIQATGFLETRRTYNLPQYYIEGLSVKKNIVILLFRCQIISAFYICDMSTVIETVNFIPKYYLLVNLYTYINEEIVKLPARDTQNIDFVYACFV